MALQTNLNKKDKITIAVVLFAALIFALIWFLIKPTVSSILTTSDKIEQAQLTQEQYKSKIMFLSSAETVYDKTGTYKMKVLSDDKRLVIVILT